MSLVRAVIFDLGHTLWDFAPTGNSRRYGILRLRQVLEQTYGADTPLPRAIDRAIAAGVEKWYAEWNVAEREHVQPPTEQLVAEALSSCGIECARELSLELTQSIFGAEIQMPVVPPDTLATIATLDALGVAMGCVTNTITSEPGISDALRRLGMLRYFRSVVVSTAIGRWKPHASLFQRALDDLGVKPDDAVFVGDRLIDDISGAKSVGMRAVLTHQFRQEKVDCAPVPPDAVITRLSELPAVIHQLEQK